MEPCPSIIPHKPVPQIILATLHKYHRLLKHNTIIITTETTKPLWCRINLDITLTQIKYQVLCLRSWPSLQNQTFSNTKNILTQRTFSESINNTKNILLLASYVLHNTKHIKLITEHKITYTNYQQNITNNKFCNPNIFFLCHPLYLLHYREKLPLRTAFLPWVKFAHNTILLTLQSRTSKKCRNCLPYLTIIFIYSLALKNERSHNSREFRLRIHQKNKTNHIQLKLRRSLPQRKNPKPKIYQATNITKLSRFKQQYQYKISVLFYTFPNIFILVVGRQTIFKST